MAKDAEAAHVAAGGVAKEKNPDDEKPKDRVEAWLDGLKQSKLAQKSSWFRGACAVCACVSALCWLW